MTAGVLSRRRLMIGVGLLTIIDGCTTTPNSKFYTLAPRPGTAAGRAPATVAVKPVELAKYLDRPQIVRFVSAYELNIGDLERWGEEMRDMVTRVLIANLSLRLPGSQITATSGALTGPADATVEVDISRFDADPNGTVFLNARWAVQRDTRPSRPGSDQISIPPASPSVPDFVAAMSDALGRLSDHIAQVLAA